MRFNMRSVLIAFVYVAVGCVALVRLTDPWITAVVSLTVATLSAAAIVALYSQGETRAIWGSLSVAGFLYLALIFASTRLGGRAEVRRGWIYIIPVVLA
jgi:hypothetical protein